MNNPNPKLRNAFGVSALTALSLVMIGCGGSSSSAPNTATTNQSPTTPLIVGPTNAITLHPQTYNLSATDPEGDLITFTVSGATTATVGPTSNAGSFIWAPTAAQTGAQTLTAIAKDSKGASSAPGSLTVNVAANRPPQFLSQPTGQYSGSTNVISFPNFVVAAQDPDGDDTRFALTGTPTFVDNLGGTTGIGGSITVNAVTGVVSFTGTVPTGKTSVTATFTVRATDQLPGSGTVLGATADQTITLTYFNGNLPPVITTSSLPNLPLNHYIPTSPAGTGFSLAASDPNGAADTNALVWTMTASQPGLQLSSNPTSLSAGSVVGSTAYILTNASFVPLTSTSQSITVTLTVTDPGGLSFTKVLIINPVSDAVPTLNSNVYTETVSGVVAFDPSRVKGDITGRARFYPGIINWIAAPYGAYAPGETNNQTDALATDNAFSNYALPYPGGFLGALIDPTAPASGWNARTLFKDNEGDGVKYRILPGSVFVSGASWNTVGQTFTLITQGSTANTFPKIPGGVWPFISPRTDEYPTVDANLGTISWRPVIAEEIAFGTPVGGVVGFYAPVTDNLANPVWSQASVWSFTVEATEQVFNPNTTTPVPIPTNKGQQNYTVKVQPNNRPTIGKLTTIPGAQLTVPGALINQVVNPLTTVSIGGGPSLDPTAFGRPSIQEPESLRYDTPGSTDKAYAGLFDYTLKNAVKPAVWRWLVARPGGDPTVNGNFVSNIPVASDVEIYDADQTTVTGHQDAIFASMGTPVVPAADTTGNVPTLSSTSVSFYNPWLTAGNAGAFEVNWGPNRIQYLIARVTASAAYSFPVQVRDQYERINNSGLGINPIFGTVRFTNARTRLMPDASAEFGATKRTGTLAASANPGDPATSPSPYTFTYLPFLGAGSVDETNMSTFLFSGNGPASGTTGTGASALYTAASWITLNATEAPYTGYHTGNPLNDEAGTFNLPAYAQAQDGTASSVKTDWKAYNYTFVNGSNPTNPVAEDRTATGSWANHEVRAQVIPSNSPYLFTFSNDPGASAGYQKGFTFGSLTRPTEVVGSTLMLPRWGYHNVWYQTAANAHGWVYNLYQGEIDMQNAASGRSVTFGGTSATTLRWTYSWPSQVTNVNLGGTTGGPNNWVLGDVMQIATPNMGANGRFFFTGDGGQNDPQAANVQGWGYLGMSPTTDATNVFGAGALNTSGFTAATNTAFHVASDSIWISSNTNGSGPITNQLNLPNRVSFSPGTSASQLPMGGSYSERGYIDFAAPNMINAMGDFASAVNWRGANGKAPGLLNLVAGDNTYFLWLRHDPAVATAWGTWDASVMVPSSTGTYTATGGLTTVPAFVQGVNVTTSTLPPSFGSEAQISLAGGNLPGQNHAANVTIGSDPSLYNANIVSAQGWARSQWGLMAPTVGYQPSLTNNVRMVNPAFDSTVAARWNNQRGPFHTLNPAAVSYDGGVRDSAIVYGVRRHTDEKGNANAELGLAGIEPGSPMLAQWYNLQLGTDPALNASTIITTNMTDVIAAWPSVFSFYSPFTGDANWANVMEFKMNFLVGVTYPDANAPDPTNVSTNTLWKVPAQVANVFPLGAPVTDPTCTNPGNTINPGNPILRPIQFLRISDFTANTAPGTIQSTLDLVTSNVTNAATGTGAVRPTGTNNFYIKARSNVRLTWQASVNNQVIPSGYVVELFQLTGNATTTNQPVLLASVRAGHIGGRDAIQKMYLPSMHSFSGLDGNGVPANAVYFFKVRAVWHQGVNFEKQPTKQSIPMGYADFVSSPFVTR